MQGLSLIVREEEMMFGAKDGRSLRRLIASCSSAEVQVWVVVAVMLAETDQVASRQGSMEATPSECCLSEGMFRGCSYMCFAVRSSK